MALKNISSQEIYEYSKIIENGQIIVIDNPLMLYSPTNSDDCSLVLNGCEDTNFVQDLPDLVLDAKYFQYETVPDNCKTAFDFSETFGITPQNCIDDYREPDRPEFVDINNLSDLAEKPSLNNAECDILEISDDEEVIFVKEYKNELKEGEKRPQASYKTDNSIRRNPVRNVRNKSRDLSKDVLFEEDFAFLDASDGELEEKENKTSDKKIVPVKLPKEWPINVHERPEYNAATNKIEAFDYTIREIQKKAEVAFKKPKTPPVAKRKNPKKKPMAKKGRSAAARTSKVPLEDLKPLVNSTTDMLKNYFINSKKHKDLVSSKSEICSFENKLQVLKNQALLFAIVNNLDQNEVVEKFKLLNVDNESKS